ncbi:PREDICTED: uncharacterized protein LOC109580662 [Amphimedon queenslandica]|uniref:Fibronectin type-III domain-containing protein n=1 Tax=Amphimedon queenslandica TaxID=400682 RepID=A0AAN0IXX9_AMPQE|nr:PREDICTED: uncharacterized protein LOC109580662 [Amphimedon queenslandica]XP_019849635.1 PREDICTED: uncharacterized protein LOC109580662 [Amphimedon queenslandica]|eukprot:XP_019849634.1 PREDICTED: uncharacterized protein LOC109580662 [Amphimedon queenslandica]
MATGIYWCFVLTGSFTLVVSLQFSQTVPNAGTVPCPGDRVELTCITDTGAVFWRAQNNAGTRELTSTGQSVMEGNFLLSVIAVNGNMVTSTATIESVNISLNGTTIGCSDEFNGMTDSSVYLHINVTGPPLLPVNNITVKLMTNSALAINWTEPQQCINHYIITITSNNTNTESSTVNTSSATINIIIGTNYSFIIIPIDTIGREGPPSSLIQYIWNVPAQVVNISWYQISTDSVTIWWNNNEAS